jgi:hypothetical protein
MILPRCHTWEILLALYFLRFQEKVTIMLGMMKMFISRYVSRYVTFSNYLNHLGYYFEKEGKPSPLLKQSLLYQLTFYRLQNKEPESKYFKEAYTTSNNMVRIYKVVDSEKFRQPWTGKYPKEIHVGQFLPS